MQFNVKSGAIAVSDPCYGGDRVLDAKNGVWTGEVEKKGGTNVALVAFTGKRPTTWSPTKGCLGVDSGQMSIFDAGSFGGGEDEDWYEDCCRASDDDGKESPAGGIVCCTAYGDGAYPLFVAKDKDGLVVGAKVVFVSEDEEDDDLCREEREERDEEDE